MSSVIPPEQTLEPDPWRYGWRYVRHTRADGTEELEQVPLTLEDVLHPQEGDQIVENSRHERLRRHFQDVIERRLSRQPTRLSLSDCLIEWDREDLRGHCPDLIVVERAEPWRWATWSSMHVRAEGARPLLIIEIVSPTTRDNDVVVKVEHYHRAGVPLYVILDEEEEDGPLRLLGYRYTPQAYVSFLPDAHGRLPVEPLGLYLTVVGDRVAIFDAATGEELGDYIAVCEALEAEVRAREAAEKARVEAEERMREETQARLAAEQGQAEAQERAREETQARKAAEQAQQAAESRLRDLEAELQRLRGSAP